MPVCLMLRALSLPDKWYKGIILQGFFFFVYSSWVSNDSDAHLTLPGKATGSGRYRKCVSPCLLVGGEVKPFNAPSVSTTCQWLLSKSGPIT